MMRPLLHRWPSFLCILQILLLNTHRSLAAGIIQSTIWEWSGSFCCPSIDNCDKNCQYDIKLCIGEPLDGVCTFAEHRFTIPHTVPDMYGSFLSNTNTVIQSFPVDFKKPVQNVIFTLNVTAYGNPNFVAFFQQKTINLKKNKEQRVIERNPANAKLDVSLNMICEENYYGEDCTIFCEPPSDGRHYLCTDSGKICVDGWSGALCDEPICEDDCGNGKCVAPNQCSCPVGWFGSKCGQCSPKHGCANGYCSGEAFTCKCNPNWGGENCDKIVDKCLEKPCHNGGQCFATGFYDDYKCNCPPGFTGKNCETAVLTVIQKEETQIKVMDHTGFWIFAIVVVIVFGLIVAWFIARRSSGKNLEGYRAGRRPSDIEMESLEEGRRKRNTNNKRNEPPPYDVKELSAEDLTVEPPLPPPSYEEAMGKPSSSSSRMSSSPPPEIVVSKHCKVTNEIV